MGAEPILKYTVEEYLSLEEKSLEKNEYYKGEIFAMAGASIQHNQIASNTHIAIGNHLQNRKCQIFQSDLKINVAKNSLISYPDLSIVCGAIETLQNHKDIVTNPSVLIEILSPTTQDYDRGGKFKLYRDIATLQEYILISSTENLVEKYTRQPNVTWLLEEFKTVDAIMAISTIDMQLPLHDIFREVVFSI
jgi:Uma2 family endonuclease